MNLITFGFTGKGTPIFLNQEPYTQVGTLYLINAGENSAVAITLDDNIIKLGKIPATTKGRKPKAAAEEAPKRRGRKPKAEQETATPKKRGRKPKIEGEGAIPNIPKELKKKKARKIEA
jgi:hypothetical protein